MNRRQFIKNAAPFGMMPLLGAGLPLKAVSATSPYLWNPCDVTDRCIVIIYLGGGNDIFNTNIPLDQYSEYFNHRPDLAIPQNQLITLDSTLPANQQLGLHPVMTPFKDLYDSGKMAVVQGVGYQSLNRSHFKSQQNWLEGSGGSENYNSGWIGRFFDDRYPSYAGVPFIDEPDPLGMLFGRLDEQGFHTLSEHSYEITMSGQDSNGFFSVISSLTGEPIPTIPIARLWRLRLMVFISRNPSSTRNFTVLSLIRRRALSSVFVIPAHGSNGSASQTSSGSANMLRNPLSDASLQSDWILPLATNACSSSIGHLVRIQSASKSS